ncbi:MAG: hypothetical protein ACRDQ7_04730 [Haloechinothrix sp.]
MKFVTGRDRSRALILVVLVAVRLMRNSHGGHQITANPAEDTLQQRYAAGEISHDEYVERLAMELRESARIVCLGPRRIVVAIVAIAFVVLSVRSVRQQLHADHAELAMRTRWMFLGPVSGISPGSP